MNRVAHVFLVRREVDKYEWPVAYGVTDNARELAEAAHGRCSPVVTIDFDAVATSAERAELQKNVATLRGIWEAHKNQREPDSLSIGFEALLDLVEGLLEGKLTL